MYNGTSLISMWIYVYIEAAEKDGKEKVGVVWSLCLQTKIL